MSVHALGEPQAAQLVLVARLVGPTSVSGWVTAPIVLVPSDSVFGRFDLAALKCFTCLFVCYACPHWDAGRLLDCPAGSEYA
jgi:hypothetical protein